MSKKRNWLCLIKKLFFPEVHHQQKQKCKRRRWLFGRVKRTRGLPSPPAEIVQPKPVPITEVQKLDYADEMQKKQEEFVPIVISLCEKDVSKCTEIVTNEASMVSFDVQPENHLENIAVIRIQTAFRGFLARKALNALKGFVILQAIIRGRAVRRQAVNTLKCLQTIVSIQSEVCRRRRMSQGKFRDLQLLDNRNEKPKGQISRDRRLDAGLLSKDEEIDIILRKKEAFLRSQRTRAFSFNHRNSADSDDRSTEGRLRYWLEQYVSDKHQKREDSTVGNHPKMRNIEELNNVNIIPMPRRSFHNQRRCSYTEDLPAYMATTKSAKAKSRSLSTPRLRPIQFDAYSDGDSPYKHKLSPMSSINSEVTSSTFSKVSHKSCYSSIQQKSPSLKSVTGPVRSVRNLNITRLDFKDVPAVS